MSRRSITLAIVLTLIIILAPAGLTLGATDDAAATETMSGTIVSSTAHSLILKTRDGNETFVLRPTTDGPAELEVGSTVTVTFEPADDGCEPVASTVTVDLAPYEHLDKLEW